MNNIKISLLLSLIVVPTHAMLTPFTRTATKLNPGLTALAQHRTIQTTAALEQKKEISESTHAERRDALLNDIKELELEIKKKYIYWAGNTFLLAGGFLFHPGLCVVGGTMVTAKAIIDQTFMLHIENCRNKIEAMERDEQNKINHEKLMTLIKEQNVLIQKLLDEKSKPRGF